MADPVIDEIKSRIDIADLISQRVQLKKAGRYLKGLCPFHGEKTPSFVVYPDQGNYHCFGCGKSGDAFTWLQETENLDFGEALKRLADQAGVQLPERSARRPDPQEKAAADALTAAATWYHEQLLHAPDAKAAREYLVRRGLKLETAQKFGIGWAPERRDQLVQHLKGQGFTDEQLTEGGLVRETERGLIDYMGARVVFPIRDPEGRVKGFGGRTLGDAQPKYLNSPQTTFFDKSATLYGLDLAKGSIRKDGVAVIVEGYMDVVVPHQEGFANVVASLGTALTERQLEILKKYAPTIVLALDSDAAGQAATLRGLEVARQALSEARRPVPGRATRTGYLQTQSTQLKIAVVTGGKDPDEIVREDPDLWRRTIADAVPMIDHKIAVVLRGVNLGDAAGKAAAIQELARFLVQVPDPIEWAHYVDVIAHRLRTDVRAVRQEIDRAAAAIRADDWRRAAQERERRERVAGQDAAEAAAPGDRQIAAGSGDQGRAGAPALPGGGRQRESAEAARLPGEDTTEEQLVALLAQDPQLVKRMPSRLMLEDFQQPECREIYRAVLRLAEGRGGRAAGPEWPGAAPSESAPLPPAAGGDSLRAALDGALREYHDNLVRRARREPPKTDSQVQAALADMVRRIRERNLHQRVLEAQYLLAETQTPDEQSVLIKQVAQLSSQLLRVQLERSRASLYTSPPPT